MNEEINLICGLSVYPWLFYYLLYNINNPFDFHNHIPLIIFNNGIIYLLSPLDHMLTL